MSDVRDCETCGATDVRVKRDGTLWKHRDSDVGDTCTQEVPDPAPVLMICDCGITWQGAPQQGHGMMTCEPVSDQAPDPQRYCTAIECDQPVTEPGAYRCDDHLCARGTNCLDCWEGGVEPVSDREHCAPGKCTGCCGCSSMCAETPCERRYVSDPAPTVGSVDEDEAGIECGGTAMALAMGTETKPQDPAEAFLFEDPSPSVNASGQPKEKTNWSGYLVKRPQTGDYERFKNGNVEGVTRCTTFVKAATDTQGLTDWKQCNVLVGAAQRPDIAARAHGLTWDDNMGVLMDVVEELEDIAGAKNSAKVGTEIHEMSERLDAGDLTLDDIAPYYRDLIRGYREVLEDLELEPIPGLIERTTMTSRWGGVAGTFDRIYRHKPSGTYVMGDVKSGKGAEKYGKLEIPAQLAMYTDGYNENGVYDWNKHVWEPPQYEVRTDWGLVLHMPVQGDKAFTVTPKWVDLSWGRTVGDMCHDIRQNRSGAPKFMVLDNDGVRELLGASAEDVAEVSRKEATWAERFASVTSNESATALWQEAKIAGITGVGLNELIEIARQALRDKG